MQDPLDTYHGYRGEALKSYPCQDSQISISRVQKITNEVTFSSYNNTLMDISNNIYLSFPGENNSVASATNRFFFSGRKLKVI